MWRTLSPDGSAALIEAAGMLEITEPTGLRSLGIKAMQYGWFDATHPLASTTSAAGSSTGYEVIDTTSGKTVQVAPGELNG